MPPGVNTHYSMRSATLGGLNKKDYIEELTKQLDVCQKVEQQAFNDGSSDGITGCVCVCVCMCVCVCVCHLQRNQFLEAESVEMEKERNQIR